MWYIGREGGKERKAIKQGEWWHFTLDYEPFPDTYFTFTVSTDSVGR